MQFHRAAVCRVGNAVKSRYSSLCIQKSFLTYSNGRSLPTLAESSQLSARVRAYGTRRGPERTPDWENLAYMTGFHNEVATEALPGALPKIQNTPQRCPYGLYAEQISGTSFTTPRHKNQRAWQYRIQPTCKQRNFRQVDAGLIHADFGHLIVKPNQMRWNPLPIPGPDTPKDFVQGMVSFCGSGSPELKHGLAIHLYGCNQSMERKALCNSDGDLLIVPQEGRLRIKTEAGLIIVDPGEICVIQRGYKFQVLVDGPSRGYIAEVFEGHFTLPDLGPIGANGLANPRDFQTPVAWYEDLSEPWTLVQKFCGGLFEADLDHSPFDVVAWHGNYAPYKYNLDHFCTINSVSFDHLDPSTFTVITAQTSQPGVAVCDFVIFPPRNLVAEKTFRPPYYHRNCMSEYMGNIRGVYEAKREGFVPGGGSLHSIMVGHGPDAATFERGSTQELAPVKSDPDALAFMFESVYFFRLTPYAAANLVQDNYVDCWRPLEPHFEHNDIDAGISKDKMKKD